MSYEDPCTINDPRSSTAIDGMRALVHPFQHCGQWFISLRFEGDNWFTMPLDDARGFAQRVNFAVELAHRERVEAKITALETAWASTRSGAV